MYKEKDYYCDVYDISIKIKSKSKHLHSLTHNELEKCIQINHTIEKLDFLDIEELFNNYINNHNKKFDLYPVKCDFILVFDNEFHLHIGTDLKNSPTILRL